MVQFAAAAGMPRPVHRLGNGSAAAQYSSAGLQYPVSDSAMGERFLHLASHLLGRMAKQVPGDWQRLYAHPVYLLETFVDPERFGGTCYRAANWVALGRTTGRGKKRSHPSSESFDQGSAGAAGAPPFRELLREANERRRVEVNVGELDQLLEGARRAPLSDRTMRRSRPRCMPWWMRWRSRAARRRTVRCWGERMSPAPSRKPGQARSKTQHRIVTRPAWTQWSRCLRKRAKGGNQASAVEVWRSLSGVPNGKVYVQKEPKSLIRIVGQAPIQATVYNLERLRCNLCGQVFTAEAPEGVGADKYDETVAVW